MSASQEPVSEAAAQCPMAGTCDRFRWVPAWINLPKFGHVLKELAFTGAVGNSGRVSQWQRARKRAG